MLIELRNFSLAYNSAYFYVKKRCQVYKNLFIEFFLKKLNYVNLAVRNTSVDLKRT